MKVSMIKILGLAAGLGLYDLWAKHNLKEIHDDLIKFANLNGNERVLDVGCGTGILASLLAETLRTGAVHGIDIGPRMIKISKKRAIQNNHKISYNLGSAVKLPYDDEKFDVVFTCLLLHLLDFSEKENTLLEVYRILKPKGKYVSAEFEQYSSGFLRREMLRYPTRIISECGFNINSEFLGPSVAKSHHITYRVLVK